MKNPLSITYREVSGLSPYAQNARKHANEQVKQIANSIQAFGFINPVVVDGSGNVIAGHGRLMAAKDLGLVTVPCIDVAHLTDDQVRAYRLADNKIALNSAWDNDLLKIELEYLGNVEIDMGLTGFSTPEIDILLRTENVEEQVIPPIDHGSPPITKPGDSWLLGRHRLICGDCQNHRVVQQLMAGEKAHLVFTDPPYNVPIKGHARGKGKSTHSNFTMASGEMSSEDFVRFLVNSLIHLVNASAPGALHYVCMDWRHMAELLRLRELIYKEFINLCVWTKTNGGMGSFYRSQHELVFVFKADQSPHINNVQLGKNGRNRTNIWSYPGTNSFGAGREEALALHPTVKPTALIADAILDATHPDQIVLDGFLGAGSTLLAAEQVDRIGYGVEIDPCYCDVTLQRWLEHTGIEPVHSDTGKTFSALKQEVHDA